MKNFNFTLAQGFKTEMLGKLSQHLGGNVPLAGVHSSNHFHQLFSRHALEHVALSSSLQCSLNLCIAFESCKHDYARIWEFAANRDHGVNAADIWHPEVHECNVRPVLPESSNCFTAR